MTTSFPRFEEEEWLDEDLGSPEEVASALRSLRWVNRLFGGTRMHQRLLLRATRDIPRQSCLHLMEVAAGHATVLQSATVRLQWPADRLRITLLDRSTQHFPKAAEWHPLLPPPEHITADALHIPLPDNSVDIISNCLFLHHLSEDGIRRYLAEALRVARVAVLINDLERNWLHYQLARLMSLIDPSRISRHDGPVSVQQSYTPAELRLIAEETGCPFEMHRGYLFRMGLILWKYPRTAS